MGLATEAMLKSVTRGDGCVIGEVGVAEAFGEDAGGAAQHDDGEAGDFGALAEGCNVGEEFFLAGASSSGGGAAGVVGRCKVAGPRSFLNPNAGGLTLI